MLRPWRRQLSKTLKPRAMNSSPRRERVGPEIFRLSTIPRRACSAALLVGCTSGRWMKVHRAGHSRSKLAQVLAVLDKHLTHRLAQWDEGRGFSAIRQDWAARALGLGGGVSATAGPRRVTGTFQGLAADGALILCEADGTLTAIHAGEVSFAELEALRRKTS